MSDLISRSALIKVLKDRATNEAIMGYMTAYDVTNSIIDEVEEQPTAYSVDKVVEELEERKALHERLVEYENKNGTVTEKYQHIKAIDVLSDAIEIVQEVAEEYKGGWIPCSERLPEERDWCLAVFEEVDTGFIGLPYIAEYLMGKHTIATTEDGWIIHNCTDIENEYAEYYKKLRCVAWQPLPEPFKERD